MKTILAIMGAISGVLILGLIAYLVFFFTVGNTTEDDKADIDDVRFVLNWCDLGDERIESVLHSRVSARAMGDHFDAYAIKILNVTIDEIENPQSRRVKWTPGSDLNGVLHEAVKFASGWVDFENLSWFPSEKLLFSKEIYVYPWSIRMGGYDVVSAKLIFINPSKKMVYYASIDT